MPGLHARERLVTPFRELAGSGAQLSAVGIEGLAAEDADDDLGLSPTRPAPLAGARLPRLPSRRLLCHGFLGASCIVVWFPTPVSQEPVQRASSLLGRG
jgi:hypothetical protein